MNGLRWLIDQYFQLPRWERIGNIILLAFILISIGIVSLWPEKELSNAEIVQLDKLETEIEKQKKDYVYTNKYSKNKYFKKSYANSYKNKNSNIFIPDIHTATVNDLKNAGLSKKVAFNLYNYIQKGGKIKSEADIRKIYGMTDEMATSLLAHTRLDNNSDSTQHKKLNNSFVKKEIDIIYLNTADSSQLVLVRGISPKMVNYILKFRTSIGAFHSAEQLNEVFKNPLNNFEEIKKQISVSDFKPFIKINSVEAVELKKHRYFKANNLASVLIAYREKHGNYMKPEDLKKCVLVTDEILEKIIPYLVFD